MDSISQITNKYAAEFTNEIMETLNKFFHEQFILMINNHVYESDAEKFIQSLINNYFSRGNIKIKYDEGKLCSIHLRAPMRKMSIDASPIPPRPCRKCIVNNVIIHYDIFNKATNSF